MLWNQLKAGQMANWIFGFGPGAADAWVTSYFRLGNPHNDWLKILFDYGTFGFLSLHAILFLTLTRHRLGIMIYLYSATLMMTDNVFIYMFHQVFVAMMMCTGRPEWEYLASTRRVASPQRADLRAIAQSNGTAHHIVSARGLAAPPQSPE
jgi:hypothetical protein